MIITTVSVRRLKTTHGYNNVAIELTAEIGPDEDYRKCRAELDVMVQAEIEGKDISELVAERDLLEWQIDQLHYERGRIEIENEERRRAAVAQIDRRPSSLPAQDDAS